jgi:hypothetical protein
VDLLDPLKVDHRDYADTQIHILGRIDLGIIGGQAMQAFVEQQVGILLDVFPRREHARLEIGKAKVLVVQIGFFLAVYVVAAFAHTGLAIGLEGFLDLVEMVGFRTEVAERIVAGLGRFCGRFPECHAIQAVQAVAFDDCGMYSSLGGAIRSASFRSAVRCAVVHSLFAPEDIFESAFYGCGASARRTGHCNHRVLAGHGEFS